MTLDLPTNTFAGGYPLTTTLTFTANEDSTALVTQGFTGEVVWGDGEVDSFVGTDEASFELPHVYQIPGVYFGSITASNLEYPEPRVVTLPFTVTVLGEAVIPTPPPVLVGPSIPLDSSPTENPWELDFTQDEKLLASNLKVILLTKKGERLMNPGFGTNLYRLIFDPIFGSQTNIEAEIRAAISEHEPRVQITQIYTQFVGSTQANVTILFTSRISSRVLGILLPFSRT